MRPSLIAAERNEPAYVVETAKVLAAARGISFDALGELTTANFLRLFDKARTAFSPARREPLPDA